MEERLFWIGVGMGAYVLATPALARRGRLRSAGAAALWHAFFWSGAAFGVGRVLALSLETRVGPLGAAALPFIFAAGSALWAFGNVFLRAKTPEARSEFARDDLEWAETIGWAVLLAAFLMYFVVQAFKIPSGSMRPALVEGDHLFVNKFLYGIRVPYTSVRFVRLRPVARGDVAVFRFPTDDPSEFHCGGSQYGKDFIKRVVGLPGERVEVREGVVQIDGRPLEEPYARFLDASRAPLQRHGFDAETYQGIWQSGRLSAALGEGIKDHFGPVTVPQGSYFMLGDNRDHSCDSRFWGPVPERYLKGKAWFVYWPVGRMRSL